MFKMKKETRNGCYRTVRTVRRNTIRIWIFALFSITSIITLWSLLLNVNPRTNELFPYLLVGNVSFMGITTVCTLAKSFYIGKSYDMDHFWIFPTIGFNGKSMYIIWLRFEIFVTY